MKHEFFFLSAQGKVKHYFEGHLRVPNSGVNIGFRKDLENYFISKNTLFGTFVQPLHCGL